MRNESNNLRVDKMEMYVTWKKGFFKNKKNLKVGSTAEIISTVGVFDLTGAMLTVD